MMPCVEPFRIMITIVVANHFPNTSPWDKFNKLTKYWLSGKKITFVHGCLKCGNLKLTIRGQPPPYSLYYFLPDTSDLKFVRQGTNLKSQIRNVKLWHCYGKHFTVIILIKRVAGACRYSNVIGLSRS